MRLYWFYAFHVSLLCGVLLISAGCKEDKAVQSATGQDTPQESIKKKEDKAVRSVTGQDTLEETIKKAAESYRSKNLDDYLDIIRCTESQREYAVAMFGLHEAYELQRALVEKFGDGAWDELQSVDMSPEFGASFSYGVPPLGDEWHENLEIEINGDRATWVTKWGRRPAEQYFLYDKEQEAWFLVLPPGTPEDEESIQAMCEFPRKLVRAARAGLKAVDEPNITVREIKLRMGDEFFQRPRKNAQ